MGISRGTISLLGMTLQKRQEPGRVLTFGVQKIGATSDEVQQILDRYGFPPFNRKIDESPQTALFSRLGYEVVDSIDYYPDEKPTIRFDLNFPIQADLQAKFDLVYDGGTMEHCFDPAQVLRNSAALVAPEGTVIHHVPMNNWVDHGFYQFSPTLFFDYYAASGFTDLCLKIHFQRGQRESYIEFDPSQDVRMPYALGGRRRVLAFFSARRGCKDSSVVPQSLIQGRYRATFGGELSGTKSPGSKLGQRLHASMRKRFLEWSAISL